VLVGTLQHLGTIAQKILHQKDGDGINAYSNSNHAKSAEPDSQRAETRKVVNDTRQNTEAESNPVNE